MTRMLDTLVFHALGTACSIRIAATPLELPAARRAAVAARSETEACERILSRFDPGSDLCRLNASGGRWVRVDERLVAALTESLRLRDETGGRCDPTLLSAIEALGYDRSYEELDGRAPGPAVARGGEVEVDAVGRRARVAPPAAVDLGATAKGLIAERALAAAVRAWPALGGAVIDLGGDVAVWGTPPGGGAWFVDVEDPRRPEETLGTLRVDAGGIATSGPTRRRFGPDRSLHHLLDTASRLPAEGGPLAVTVVAPRTVDADGHATALAVTPVDDAAGYVAARPGLGAVLVLDDGTTSLLGDVRFTPIRALETAP